jgi:hypothetical protein
VTSSQPRISRALAITRTGRFVAARQPDGIHVVDSIGPAPRRRFPALAGETLGWLGEELWWTDEAGALRRPGHELATPLVMTLAEPILSIVPGTAPGIAVAEGGERAWLIESAMAVELERTPGSRILALSGRRLIEASGTTATLRTIGQPACVRLAALDGIALGAAFVMAGRVVALWVRGPHEDAIVTYTIAGQLISRIPTAPLHACVFAEDANLALGAGDDRITAFDVRYGSVRASCAAMGVVELDVDRLGRNVVTASRGDDGWLDVTSTELSKLFADRTVRNAVQTVEVIAPPALEESLPPEPVAEPAPEPLPPPTEPDPLPIALSPAIASAVELVWSDNGAKPYRDGGEHVAALLDVVAARVALAIAESWHSGRASHDGDGDLPCEREVLGLLGEDVGLAADALRGARGRLRERATEMCPRTEATVAARIALPLHEIVREYGLSAVATQILVCAAAPRLRASIARLYGVLAGLRTRSVCADHLLDVLVETEGGYSVEQAIARELSPEAPLVRTGLVVLVPRADRMEVLVDGVLVDRLRGVHRTTEISDATTRRLGALPFEDVVAPAELKQRVVAALASRDAAHPVRFVVRGRRGSGRHTLIAALAHRVGRPIAEVDATRLPGGAHLAPALAAEMSRARFAGCLPVISGLDALGSDAEVRRQVETVLRRHTGPLAVRAAPDSDLPLDPDRIDVVLPPLSLVERTAVWKRALEMHGLELPGDAGWLAQLTVRFRFGAGTITRIVAQVARRAATSPGRVAELIDEVARHHISGRLERVATRVTRLPDWDQVTLVDEMRDSVRELVGRMRHQRTVFEDWGFDRRITTARGLTALFYGPPGTGKTLVAGLIGRELDLDVWRIDLSRVMSKWVGETEKQLGEVFDAAEEGQVMLLFDEADSLFGKRSEVKSSNDRYANLETNYLLQRLDTFEGVAVLTTNLEGSIDPAFKRRLSMRMYFPFPDEELREQLWAAHVPPSVPCAGPLDFVELARRFPLSGGYIRNSALRAAFLAAQERRPMSQDHLIRAVELEYRELGKLSSSGRVD